MHVELRTGRFDPWRAPRGPGRKTRLGPTRRTIGVCDNGDEFDKNGEWQNEDDKQERLSWTGKTIYIVDHHYSKAFGTDQRRQRASAHNKLELAMSDR